MSLHHLGIAHFPVLHRQFSSPITSPRSIQPSPREEDLTEDNKDVLIERLHDVVLRLSKDNSLENTTIAAIHHKVDEVEILMREGSRRKSPSLRSGSFGSAREDDTFWGPRTPTQSLRMRLPEMVKTSPQSIRDVEMTTKAIQIARDAEQLTSQLSKAIAELQIRREESDHIHDLLVARAEKAAERILLLEYRIAEMEDDFDANQSELKFLRIQLQSIEAQCSQYIPRDADQELTESIMNWKVDWEDIDRRSKARRKKCNVSAAHKDDTESVIGVASTSLLPILRAVSDR
ncbi:Uncharacterized protein BP5553_03356 [Venustampulla echinocandica]|uniref:Uncharacterized protein n=1 Tax=Venustampulla echinocandica TaxID=2656787 RepID=A0A370TU14_9HELO|nr:Uncharacterized protein BP5553_03356 [Venustampulla echinocandica]RDL39016.1 Uncharacterized protein BP5553_03356 [Venustampulla echinocandica]